MSLDSRFRQGLLLFAGFVATIPFLVGQGCPPGGGFGGGPTVQVSTPSIDKAVTAGQDLTVTYDVQGNAPLVVTAFYDRDGIPDSGDEITVDSGLSGGTAQVAQLDTSVLVSGQMYNVGISASSGGGVPSTDYAAGQIVAAADSDIIFSSPTEDLEIGAGEDVTISFTPGAGESSKRVIVGPRVTSVTRASMLKVRSVSSSRCPISRNFASRLGIRLGSGISKRSIEGLA